MVVRYAAACFCLFSFFAFTYVDATQTMTDKALTSDAPAWSVDAEYEYMHRAKIYKPHSHHGDLSLTSKTVLANYTHETSDMSGFRVGLGYLGMNFDFSKSRPRKPFTQHNFDNALFNIGYYTQEADRWKWDADLLTQISTENFALSRYSFFTGLLKGRYAWKEHQNLYVGILAYAGMRYSRALPVLGFDYTPSDKWRFVFVYPLTMAYTYLLDEHWELEAGIRYFLNRQRLGKDARPSRGFVAFRTWGAEVGINYNFTNRAQLNLHIGQTLANRMRVSDHHDHDRTHYRMRQAPYVGFVATFAF